MKSHNRHHESLTYTLPETNMTSPLKMDGFQARNLLEKGVMLVSGRVEYPSHNRHSMGRMGRVRYICKIPIYMADLY